MSFKKILLNTKIMRKLFLTLAMMLIAAVSFAYDVEVNGIYYDIKNASEVEVTYKEFSSGNSYDYRGSVVIPTAVNYYGSTYSVTGISSYAFHYCPYLTSVTIPNTVKSIGNYAFAGCSSLTSITIPNSVTSIGWSAFQNCTSLPVIDGILYADTYIEKAIDQDRSSYTIQNGTRFINTSAFSGCSSLKSITIPNSVESIGALAFKGCSNLSSVTISNRVTRIDSGTFFKCSSLTSVTIPNSVKYIGNSAFEECSALTSVAIGNSVNSIEYNAFYGCDNLSSITVDRDNLTYDNRGGCNAIIETATNKLVLGCKATIIPNSVTSIGNWAFSNCHGLTSITIPNRVTSIGNGAFYSCTSLMGITIPNSVTSIGSYAFEGCSSLTSVTIPNSVTSIGWSAFSDCSALTSVTIPNSVTTIGNEAFHGCSLNIVYAYALLPADLGDNALPRNIETLYVPTMDAVNSYKKTNWKNYFFDILPMTDEMLDVKNIQCDTPATQTYYDLNGRKMKQAQHGLNIINGKKIVVK